MGDVLNEAYNIARCKECPWYKSCLLPMRFTAEDIQKQLSSGATGTGQAPLDASMQSFLSGMAIAAQNSLLEACPVLVERLRQNPRLSQRVKQLMQNWATEESKEEDKKSG